MKTVYILIACLMKLNDNKQYIHTNMKQRIRLTESDIHRIIKESVNRILNEVEFGGESLHGTNPEDWAATKHLRDRLTHKNFDDYVYGDDTYDEYNKNFERNFKNLDRDAQNEFDLLDDMYPNDDSKSYGRRRGLDAKGEHKARSIRKNLGIK